jgi:hypothetical protein
MTTDIEPNMITRYRVRKLRRKADRCYDNGQRFESWPNIPAPASAPLRIAFDAGREQATQKTYQRTMPTDIWLQVLGEWFADRHVA